MKEQHSTKGAKGSESAQSEGLRNKQNVSVKNMHGAHDKSQRTKKGSDRI